MEQFTRNQEDGEDMITQRTADFLHTQSYTVEDLMALGFPQEICREAMLQNQTMEGAVEYIVARADGLVDGSDACETEA